MYQLIYLFLFFTLIVIIYQIFFVISNNETVNTAITHYNPVKFSAGNQQTIEGTLTCDINTLKKCNVNDKTSCFGCKNFTTVCQHFDKDTKAIVENTNSIIPKNTTVDEGYCLPMTNFASRCNPYHGDLVIGGINGNYGLFCICKNPGIITNNTMNGACETPTNVIPYPFKNINVPFDQLELQCPDGTVNAKTASNIPTCIVETIKSIGKFTLEGAKNNENYNKYLNQASDIILTYNPCQYDFITNEPTDGRLVSDGQGGFMCHGSPTTFPIRRDPYARLLKGSYGPDAVLKMPPTYILMQIFNTKYNSQKACAHLVITIDPMPTWKIWLIKTHFNGYLGYVYLFSEKHQIHFPAHFNVSTIIIKKCLKLMDFWHQGFLNISVQDGWAYVMGQHYPETRKKIGTSNVFRETYNTIKTQWNSWEWYAELVKQYGQENIELAQRLLTPGTDNYEKMYIFDKDANNFTLLYDEQFIQLDFYVGCYVKLTSSTDTLFQTFAVEDNQYIKEYFDYIRKLPNF